ncbi:MAG: hypothetical protein RLZZ414_743 [Bacteroidota bacterium]|jgi:outer membrane protein OmpA-like peptidoglycan-associated protein
MLKKQLIILIIFTLSSKLSIGQFLEGYATSNYAGINGVNFNPASVVDSRIRLDINFFTVGFTGYNSYLNVNQPQVNIPNNTIFNNATYNMNNNPHNAIFTANILGPGFVYTLNEKYSFGLITNYKSLYNYNNISNNFLNFYFNQNNSSIGNEQNFSLQNASWTEYGLVFGMRIWEKNNHWLAGGTQLKFLQGLQLNQISGKNLAWNINNNQIEINGNDIQYQFAQNVSNSRASALNNFENWGFGLDLGFNYEYRPQAKSFKREIDGKSQTLMVMSKHKLRIGWALQDIAFIRYKMGVNTIGNFSNISAPIQNLDFANWVNVSTYLASNFGSNNPNNQNFYLPTTNSLQLDYNIYRGFYANIYSFHTFKSTDDLRWLNRFVFTPRWDWKWMGIYFPQTLDELGNIRHGINLMIGPFLLGTNDLKTYLNNGLSNYANLHFGVKVTSHHYRPEDRDDDGVTDENDECIDIPGLWIFKGCPDLDGDSIPDHADECPTIKGLALYKGCADRDVDGVIDLKDSCPDVFGLVNLMGCPDKDLDGIADHLDSCPDILGLAIFKGCPDTDEDGVEDRFDFCPLDFGLAINYGCPDTDKDGLLDYQDSCKFIAGPLENKGCPYNDTDGDGIIDKKDKCPFDFGIAQNNGCPDTDLDKDGVLNLVDSCPNTFGDIKNNGCPIVEEAEKEIIEFAFKNLEFETNQAIILSESFESLDKLALLLQKKKDWKLLLSGHTDDVGNAQDNLILSKNRAKSVQEYLVNKGVQINRIKTEYYGQAKPIANNNTPEGRRKNRRVEIILLFD